MINTDEQQPLSNVVDDGNESQDTDTVNHQQIHDSQQKIEDKKIISEATQSLNENDQNQKLALQKETDNYEKYNVILNEEQQQSDNFSLNIDEIYDKEDYHIDQRTDQDHHFNTEVLASTSQTINSQHYKIEIKKEKIAKFIHTIQRRLVPIQIFLIFKYQQEFIQIHKNESPLAQLLNVGQIHDEILVWHIHYYDNKLKKEGIRFYFNQDMILCQRRIGLKQFKFTYLKPSK